MFRSRHRLVQLSPELIARYSTGSVLALASSAYGSTVSMREDAPTKPEPVGGVAVIGVHGPLLQRAEYGLCAFADGYDALTERMLAAFESPDVGAVVMVVDSPGGDVAGLEESLRRITAARDASGKPVFAYIDEQAASAAYWIVAKVATGGITMPVSGKVGSIGTITGLVDESGALEQAGIKITVIASPEGKAAGAPGVGLNDLATARITEFVEASTTRFVRSVAEVRGLQSKAVRAFDGAQLNGDAAVKAGLADRIGSLEEVLAEAAAAAAKVVTMKTEVQALRAAMSLGAEKTDAEVLSAAAFAFEGGAHTLAAEVMTLTGKEQPTEAMGVVRAWGVMASSAKEKRATDEPKERNALCAQLVASGGFRPHQVWADASVADDPDKRKPSKHYASMGIVELRSFAGTMTAEPLPRRDKSKVDESAVQSADLGISAEERDYCKATGRNTATYARFAAQAGVAA